MNRTLRIPADVAPDGIATVSALRAAGVSASMIARRCRPGGPWRRLQPGVVMLSPGTATRRQLQRAAVALAGPEAVISGADALRAHGVNLPAPRSIRLLVSNQRRLLPREFVIVERTTRMPAPVVRGGLPFAPPVRAAVDAARTASDPVWLRSALALTVHHGLCTREELHAELAEGNQRGSAAVRVALGHFESALATVLHSRAHRLLRDAPLPAPRWNVTVCDRRRRPIGYADAWWDEVGVAWQLDAGGPRRPVHPKGHLAMMAAGVIVVRTPSDVLDDAIGGELARAEVIRTLTSAFLSAARRPRPPLEGRCALMPDAA